MAAGSLMYLVVFANHHIKIPLGIQLWTVKSEAEKDLEGTLRKVYAAGFRDIEFAGYYGKNPADLAKLMKDIGFSLVSTHAGAGDIAKNGDKIIADAKALGLKYVVCSSPGVSPEKEKLPWEERMKAVDLTDWKWNADLFNKFGKQVTDAGMVFGYHNHSAEFKKFDGKTAFDHLFAMTDAKHVKIELDVGWVAVAQQDPDRAAQQVQGSRDRAARQGRREARRRRQGSALRGAGRRHGRLEEGARHRARQWRKELFLRAGRAVHPADPRLGEDQRRLPDQARSLKP